MTLQTNKELQDAALAYSMCGPWSMRTHPKEHFNHGTGQMERYTHFLNGLEAGATEYASEWKAQYDELKAENERLNDDLMSDAVRAEYGFTGSSYSDLLKAHTALQQQHQQLKTHFKKLEEYTAKAREWVSERESKAIIGNLSQYVENVLSVWKEGEQKEYNQSKEGKEGKV